MAVDSARKPIQSKRTDLRSVCSLNANQMQASAQRPGGTMMKNAARQL